MTKLHVLLVVCGDISWGFGGVVGSVLSLARYLTTRGIDVQIVYRRLVASLVTKGLPNFDFKRSRIMGHRDGDFHLPYLAVHVGLLLFSLLTLLRLVKEHKAHKISVIHSQDIIHGGLAAILAGSLLHLPVVATSHGKSLPGLRLVMTKHRSSIGGFYSMLCEGIEMLCQRVVMKYSDVLVAVSQDTKQYLVSLGAKPEKVVVLRAGIDVEKFRKAPMNKVRARRMLGVEEKSFVIGYVGRLVPEKNVETLLKAVANVVKARDIRDIFLVLVGRSEGSEQARLLTLAQGRGIERNVLFTGFRTDIPQLLRAMDVVALLSPHEGSPRSLMEAAASGRVVLAGDIPSIRELVTHQENAILVSPHDVEETQDAIVELYQDYELRKTLGARAAAQADKYEEKLSFQTLVEIYKNLISRKQKSDRSIKKLVDLVGGSRQ